MPCSETGSSAEFIVQEERCARALANRPDKSRTASALAKIACLFLLGVDLSPLLRGVFSFKELFPIESVIVVDTLIKCQDKFWCKPRDSAIGLIRMSLSFCSSFSVHRSLSKFAKVKKFIKIP